MFQSLESPMSAPSVFANTEGPSYFYLVMAKSCFRRAVSTPHPKAGPTLREIGRDYLAMANHAPSVRSLNIVTSH
jgi:hypothetical protein